MQKYMYVNNNIYALNIHYFNLIIKFNFIKFIFNNINLIKNIFVL